MITNLTEQQIVENKNTFIGLLRKTNRDGIESLINYLENSDFFTNPASTKYHGAFEGGLVLHSLNVYNNLMKYFNAKLVDTTEEEIIIATLLHDICKINSYAKATKNMKIGEEYVATTVFNYKKDGMPYGHGEKSVDIIRDFISLTTEEKLAIRYHMGAYEGEKIWNDLTYAQEISPLAFWIHVADMEATRYQV